VYQYLAQGNKGLIVGIFYWQAAKDQPDWGSTNLGWGTLEGISPLVNGDGDEYRPRSLNESTIVAHPVMSGVSSLSASTYAGGLKAASDATVLAYWNETNSDGTPDPAVGIRGQSGSRVIAISLYPDRNNDPEYVVTGDFYTLWQNALTWAAFATNPSGSLCSGANETAP
jgi:hypothetical protein